MAEERVRKVEKNALTDYNKLWQIAEQMQISKEERNLTSTFEYSTTGQPTGL